MDKTPPEITSVNITPATAPVGQTVSCSAAATDPDGAPPALSYAWSTGATGATYTITQDDLPGAVLTCTATATDSDGGVAVGSATATVSNSAPVIADATVTPAEGRVGDTLTCSGVVTDLDAGEPALAYAWSTGEAGPSVTITSAVSPGEPITCTLTATDVHGGETIATASAAVLNPAPTAPVVAISPAEPAAGDALSCAVVVESDDADEQALGYAFSWTVDGVAYTGATDGALNSVVDGAAVGADQTWRCAVVASDGLDESDVGQAEVVTVEACGDRAVSEGWVCGDELVSLSDIWTRAAYDGAWHSGGFGVGAADAVNETSDRAPTCGAESWRLDDGTTQTLITPQSMLLSCDGVYDVTLVGRINEQLQRGLTLQVDAPSTPYVWMDRWVWNSAREAGANSGVSTHDELIYNYRLDWWGMPSSAEWFDIRLEINTITDTCTSTFTSASHVRAHTFDCVLPDDVAPAVGVVAWGPMEDRGGTPNADLIGVFARPALQF